MKKLLNACKKCKFSRTFTTPAKQNTKKSPNITVVFFGKKTPLKPDFCNSVKDVKNRVSSWIGVKPSLISLKLPPMLLSDSDDLNAFDGGTMIAYYFMKVKVASIFDSEKPFEVELSSLVDWKEFEFRIRSKLKYRFKKVKLITLDGVNVEEILDKQQILKAINAEKPFVVVMAMTPQGYILNALFACCIFAITVLIYSHLT